MMPLLETAIGALFGTAGGAGLVYLLQLRHETQENHHRKFVAGMNAAFSLDVHVAVLSGFKKHVLDAYAGDQERHAKILPSLVPSAEPALDLGGLGFIVERRNPQLAKRLSEFAQRFSNVREIVKLRNESYRRIQADRAHRDASVRSGYPPPPTGVEESEIPTIKSLTEMLYESVPEGMKVGEQLRTDLLSFLASEFPNENLESKVRIT